MSPSLPTTDAIEAIGIDERGSLWVKPVTVDFRHIYRTAMEVHWDEARRTLYSPRPREWSHVRWFRQIRDAAIGEYRVELIVTPDTVWSNIDPGLRRAISEICEGLGAAN